MAKILLKDATVMCENTFKQGDVLIENEFITQIEANINIQADKVINCHGLLVLPGLIDAHVHFREPGMPQKGTIYSESRAAALGGVTSFMDMPNTMPPTTSNEALKEKKAIAQKDSIVNYGFYLGASSNNLEEIKKVNPKEVAGIKIYMGSTTGNLLLDEESTIFKIFKEAPTLIATHCEDNTIINKNMKQAKASHGNKIPFECHPIIRSRDCCLKSSALAIEAAVSANARLHIMHLSSKEEIELLRRYATNDLFTRLISAEVCIPHLFFNDSNYSVLKGYLKCNPAVKYERDRRLLVQALRQGIISTIGTDHAPHEKSVKQGDNYLEVASGIPSVQFSLSVIFDLYKRGEISLEEGIKAASFNVAQRFGIAQRGLIKEGYYADLAIIDPINGFKVHEDDIASLCKWSPFVGHNFNARVIHTIASGKLVVENSQICAESGEAKALVFSAP